MEFKTLKITNFLAIGDADTISLDDRGLCLIQGVNEDDSSATSNGVGKSSIVDALCWCIYGETARDVSGDSVVNTVAKKDTSVEVVLVDGASKYRITRHRKHTKFKNSTIIELLPDGSPWVDISKGTEKETQEFIVEIMGCTLDVFMAAIYAGQEATPDLPRMTDKELKLLIEEAAGVERLEKAYEIARKKLNDTKSEVAVVQAHLESAKKRIEESKRDIDAVNANIEFFEKGRPTRSKHFEDAAQEAKKDLVTWLTAVKGYDAPALEKRASELADALSGHSKLLRHYETLTNAVTSAERLCATAKVKADIATKKALDLKGRFDNAESELTKSCPSCGRPGDAHNLDDYKAHIRAQLLTAVSEAKALNREVEGLQQELVSASAEAEKYAKTIPDTSEIGAEQQKVAEQLRALNAAKEKARNFKALMDSHNEKAEAVRTEVNPHESAREALLARLKKQERELKDYEEKFEKSSAELLVFEDVAKVFSPAGVRAHILDTVTPFLNDRTADYLSALSDGNISAVWTTLAKTSKGDLKEKFTIEVSNDKGAKSFAGLSGGEKRKVRLATMLALQDLVSSRASKPIQLWLGDEIDDALDVAGLERLMGILERKARERGTVLVVSHRDLRDWIDQTLTVTKRGGVSVIEGALV